MKKIKIFLIFTMLFSLLIVKPKAMGGDYLYAKTDVTGEYDEYVRSVFDELILTQDNIVNYDDISLGKGIKVFLPEETYDYYVYPVFFGTEIEATIHVTKDSNDDFGVTYTKFFAEQLNTLKKSTSLNNPLILVRQNGYVYCQIDTKRTLVEYRQFNEENIMRSTTTLENLPNIDTTNVPVKNIYEKPLNYNSKNVVMPRAVVSKLSWTVYETQPSSKPWCASITTSNIVRNKGKSMTSSQMRSWLGITNRGLSNAEVVKYLKNYHKYSNTLYTTSGSLSLSSVISEIDAKRAIFAHFRNSKDGHAIAIIGYNTIANAYHIHNPWYSYTETMSIGGTYASGTYNLKWTGGTIYNIR